MDMRKLGYFAVSLVLTLALIFGVRALANVFFTVKKPAKPAIAIPQIEEEKKGGEEAEAKTEAAQPAATEEAKPAAAEQAAQPAAVQPAAEQQPAQQASAAAPAAGDPAKGKKVFNKCKACHFADKEKNKVGPYLKGVVGRPVASVEGFKYSDAMKAKAAELGTWTKENLARYLANPKGLIPGNKMAFAGLKKPQDIADVIAYLESVAK